MISDHNTNEEKFKFHIKDLLKSWKYTEPSLLAKWTSVINHPCYSWTFVESFWWGLMTITTVGYGNNLFILINVFKNLNVISFIISSELNPKTLLGKVIGGFCALSGVFILTLPIPIVVNSFAVFYKNRLWRNEVEHKKRERTMQLAAELRAAQKFHLIQVRSISYFTFRLFLMF